MNFKQIMEEKVRKLQMQVREIEAVREENKILIETIKNLQKEEWNDETGPV